MRRQTLAKRFGDVRAFWHYEKLKRLALGSPEPPTTLCVTMAVAEGREELPDGKPYRRMEENADER
jgi:hypothetical protein